MEKLIVKLTKYLLSKFAPNYHIRHNPRKILIVNFPREGTDE